MVNAVQNNSFSILTWCQNQTDTLFTPLPADGKIAEIARRVLVAVSLIIPLLGLIANRLCANPVEMEVREPLVVAPAPILTRADYQNKLKQEIPTLHKLFEKYKEAKEIPFNEYRELYHQVMIQELGYTIDEIYIPDAPEEGYVSKELDPVLLFQRIRDKIGMNQAVAVADENLLEDRSVFGYFLTEDKSSRLAIANFTPEGKKFFRICHQFHPNGEMNPIRILSEEELLKEYALAQPITVTKTIPANKYLFPAKFPSHNGHALETSVALLSYLLGK